MTPEELAALPVYTIVRRVGSTRTEAGELVVGDLGTILPSSRYTGFLGIYVHWHRLDVQTWPYARSLEIYHHD